MDPWWPLVLAAYWGMSIALLGAQYAEADRADPDLSDVLVMVTVGPLVLAWVCAARFIRQRRGHV